jgi:putative flippase GtrA
MLNRELSVFIIVGTLTVIVDFLAYRGIALSEIFGVELAKAFGFIIGTIFAYFANRFWTFAHKPKVSGSAWRFAILYSITLAINVLINSTSLTLLPQSNITMHAAFLLATGTSAALNFTGMKFYVFKSVHSSELQ